MIDVVCGVIQNESGEILACRRPEGKHLGGFWEFPGGKVEEGEIPADSLVRELREELEIGVEVGEPLSPVAWDYGSVSIRLLPFVCRVRVGRPRPVEHTAVRWCAPESLRELEWAPADVPVISEILAMKGF